MAELRRELATDPSAEVDDLVKALGAIGPAAAEALPVLEKIKARYDDVDNHVARAVRRISTA